MSIVKDLSTEDEEKNMDQVGFSSPYVTFNDITCAAFRIRNHVVRTRCNIYRFASQSHNMKVYLKKEISQITGSFKERGACYSLLTLTEEQKKKGVISASLGNHSQALCYHAGRLGVPATVFMPIVSPLVKIESCKRYGATVMVEGENMAEAKKLAMKYAEQNDLKYINGYDDAAIIAGQGTIGLEIIEDTPDVDAIVVPIGGGGLIAGIALAVKTLNKNIKIIGVESEKCPSFSAALEHGKPVEVHADSSGTLSDGLAVSKVGDNAFKIAAPLIDKMIVIEEKWILLTILRLLEKEKCVVEGAGAIGLAAIMAGQLDEFIGKKIVVILCGGNIDTNILGRCIERSLVLDGRLLKFSTTVSDRPGSVSELCKILADVGVSIKHIEHERALLVSDVFQVIVTVCCETRDHDHVREVKDELMNRYASVVFADIDAYKLKL